MKTERVYAPGGFRSHTVYTLDSLNELVTWGSPGRWKGDAKPRLNGRDIRRPQAASLLRAIRAADRFNAELAQLQTG